MNEQMYDATQLLVTIKQEILRELSLKPLGTTDEEIEALVNQVVDTYAEDVATDKQRIVELCLDEFLHLGPLEPLLKDPRISEIQAFGQKPLEDGTKPPPHVIVEIDGKMLSAGDKVFTDDDHLKRIIDRIGQQVGRGCTAATPFMDARLSDGSRVNATDASVSIDGPSLNIRRFKKDAVSPQDMIAHQSCPPLFMAFLRRAVLARLNIIVTGGTGTGKTTLLNVLGSFIPPTDNIVTIEDSAELQLQQPFIRRMEARPANLEGSGEVSIHACLVNALRMRPDRIIVGECRSDETIEMLQAMQTGHDGSLTTVHANVTPSAEGAIQRITTMVTTSQPSMSLDAVARQISQAVDLIVQLERDSSGQRRISSIVAIEGFSEGMVSRAELFRYDREGTDENGVAIGRFVSTGANPARIKQRFIAAGMECDPAWFDPDTDPWRPA